MFRNAPLRRVVRACNTSVTRLDCGRVAREPAVRILIAEDGPTIAELLAEEGFGSSVAADSEAALRLGQSGPWVAALVDIFRAMAGPEPEDRSFLSELGTHAPRVILSARGWAMQADLAQLGVAAIVPKPYDIDELLRAIRAAIGV